VSTLSMKFYEHGKSIYIRVNSIKKESLIRYHLDLLYADHSKILITQNSKDEHIRAKYLRGNGNSFATRIDK
jgi:hypothetical protein